MTDRILTLVLSDTKTEKKSISVRVLQESSLFLIFYLFYTARLVNGSGRVGLGLNPTPTRPRLGLEFGKPTRPDYPPGYPVGYPFNPS